MARSALPMILLTGVLAAFLISVPTASAEPNLISWWALDEGSGTAAYDSAGNNHGSITGATWTTGQIDGALSFDGSVDYVFVGDKADLEQPGFTLSFWAQLNSPTGALQGGIAKGWIFGAGTEYSYKLDFNGGNANATITNASNDSFGISAAIVNDDWHMWSMTAGGGTVTLYKDGAFVNNTGYTGVIDYSKSHNTFVIGARDTGAYSFNGKIDDVRFYDGVLSPGEVGQLYQDAVDGKKAIAPNPFDGATDVDPCSVLNWSPGEDAASHDVYLGTDYSDVNNANTSSPEYKGSFDVNSFDPCGLEPLATYYWRIDEVNDSNLWKGYIWSFGTGTDDPNFISLWRFDEGSGATAYDSVSNNDGSITGTTWTTGQINGALSFDGSGDYVLVGDKDNLEQQKFTLSFWAQLNNPSGSAQGGIAKGYIFGSPTEYSYKVDFSDGNANAAITNTSDTGFGISAPIADGDWHMWTMTVDGNTLTLYKDWSFADSTSYTGSIDYTKFNNSFVIGARNSGSYSFDGKIDDVRFYNRVLYSGEIGQLYQDAVDDKKAIIPNPFDGATGVDPDAVLRWTPGKDAVSHDVYLGTDYTDVNDTNTLSPAYKGNFDVNNFDPCGLELMTTYYWRIDEMNDSNLWKGYIWSFETDGPEIGLSAAQFQFTAIEGGANPEGQILGISNSGAGTLNWETNEDCNWLFAEPSNGSSTGETDEVALSADISGLAAGTYTYNMVVSEPNASNNPQTVGITLYIGHILYVPSEYSTIQAAINDCNNGDAVIVSPGTYTGAGNRDIDFMGKVITVQSESGPESCTIDCGGSYEDNHRGFYFDSGEGRNSVLEGFTITNGYVVVIREAGAGIYIEGTSPTIRECIVTNNHAELDPESLNFCLGGGIYIGCESNPLITDCVISKNLVGDWGCGGGIYCEFSQMALNNCLLYNNTALGYQGMGSGIYCDTSSILTAINCSIAYNQAEQDGGGIYFGVYESPTRTISNSTIWGNSPDQIYAYDNTNIIITYSDIQGSWQGTGNINADPCFADPCNGDYHLKSQAGRWDPNGQSWAADAVTSPCVDSGDPNSDWTAELWPHGKQINMGTYGGAPEASMSLSTVGNIANLDNDPCDIIDFNDLALFVGKWLHEEVLLAEDLDRNGTVNFSDYAIFAQQWLDI